VQVYDEANRLRIHNQEKETILVEKSNTLTQERLRLDRDTSLLITRREEADKVYAEKHRDILLAQEALTGLQEKQLIVNSELCTLTDEITIKRQTIAKEI